MPWEELAMLVAVCVPQPQLGVSVLFALFADFVTSDPTLSTLFPQEHSKSQRIFFPSLRTGCSAVSLPNRWPVRSRFFQCRFPSLIRKYLVIWCHVNAVHLNTLLS